MLIIPYIIHMRKGEIQFSNALNGWFSKRVSVKILLWFISQRDSIQKCGKPKLEN